MILRNRMGKSIIEVGVDDAETNSHTLRLDFIICPLADYIFAKCSYAGLHTGN
jgi:hypothetical protein